ncbi:MAG: hypothetical protein Q4Q19_08835 [Methanobrevibacter sp.]|nr:hypothetical protein [Methanobrevibacter sp.]
MSGVVAFIFGIPNGLSVEMWFEMWPVRWLVAYLMVVIFVDDISFKLAMKVFGFRPGIDSIDGLWNPIAFFMSFMMSMLMPAIFGLTTSMSIEQYIWQAPLRWFVAYLLIDLIVLKSGFYLAEKVFGFDTTGAH